MNALPARAAQLTLLAFMTLAAADAPGEESHQQIEQRIRLTAALLGDSPAAQRIRASGHPQATAHLDDGRVHHALSEDALARGDLAAARAAADEALRHLAMARRLVPDALARQTAARSRQQQLLTHLERLLGSWNTRQPPGDGVDDGDRMAALGLIETARQFAASGRHEEALHVLHAAEGHVIAGLDRLLQSLSRELDYTPRATSPEQAFELELRRHEALAELVPQAMAQLRPAPDAHALIQRYGQASRALREQAVRLADTGDPKQAVAQLRNATLYLQRALGAAGLVTPAASEVTP